MPTNPNIKAIQTVIVEAGGASTIQFTSIPQTYTDLKIVLSGRTTNSSIADSVYFSFNSSTANFGAAKVGYGDGSSTSAFTQTRYAGSQPGLTATASTFSNIEIYIPNYAGSNVKSYSVDAVTENNATTAYTYFASGVWTDTSAITSITLTPNAGTFVQYSKATLYGITSAAVGAKATGGAVYSDSTYWYHVFGSSDTFAPTQNLTADVLIVAGGGGGGNGNGGGGGGAGGVLGLTAQSLTTTTYAVTIGGGGAMSTDGTNSSFASSTALKGGRGGDAGNNGAGGSGTYGSGGGCGRDGGTLGGAGTSGQGFAGGNSAYPAPDANGGSGGGGAGGAGNNVITTDNENRLSPNGDGGVGTNAYASWLSAVGAGVGGYLAGGGGGSAYQGTRNPAGGLGGGGQGTMSNFGGFGATAGVINTGSGGGGGGTGAFKSAGQPGGSGLVIIRYAK